MATIIRSLWGAHPPFLTLPAHRGLYQVVAHRPRSGVGLRVIPTKWYKKGWEGCYWTVEEVVRDQDPSTGILYGKLTWRGKETPQLQEIRQQKKLKWHVYEPPEIVESIMSKVPKLES
ncbi:hypothetical protein DFS34DRAFT_646964 [Phlyctochytrium arcticum]|nr:hypothetical protein DFS34DRAFT_646964 [Phlyctochytrium arcticum]